MDELFIQTLKTVLHLGGVFVVALVVAIFLLSQFPHLKLLTSTVLGWFGGAGKWFRRRSLETEIEGAVNSFSKSFNRNYSFNLLPECDVQWVTARNQGTILKPGKAIVKLSFSRDDHDLNFYNAAQSFVEAGLLPDTRPYLVRATAKAIDLLMIRTLLLQGRRQALRIFNSKFTEQEAAAKATYSKLAETDEEGLFRHLFLPELHLFGQVVRQKPPTAEIIAETETFVDWFYELATRPPGELTKLGFDSENIKVGVILVADPETYERFGIKPYLHRGNLYAARDCQCIYVLSRGRRRADIASKIADRLCETGGYSILSRRTAAVRRLGDEDVLVTCIALKPDITTIVFNAWQRLGEDFAAARTVTATVEHVTEESLMVDVYGIDFELDRDHLSSVPIGPIYRFFERDQALELRILGFDATAQTAELTNCGTASDPKALAELVEANAGQTVEAQVEKVITSRDFEVGWMLATQLGDQSVKAFLPRSKATFSRYVSLAAKYPVASSLSVRIEKYDLEHGALTCSIDGLVDPWNPPPPLKVGSKVTCSIREVTENHATCEILEGLEARLYHEELSWDTAEANREKIRELVVGTAVEAVILRIEPERRYVAISVKRLVKSETEEFFDALGEEAVDVRIDAIGPIGATVSFPNTPFAARLHINDIVWGYCERIDDYLRVGDVKTVKCLAYDNWADTIRVGIKQLDRNDFDEFLRRHQVGSTALCEVNAVSRQSNIRVRVIFNRHQTFGYIHRAELSWLLYVDNRIARHIFRERERFHCCVKRFDLENQLVEFSRKQYLEAQRDTNEYGVTYRARLVFQNREVFGYGDRLEGRIVDTVHRQRNAPSQVDVMLSRKGRTPRDVELSLV